MAEVRTSESHPQQVDFLPREVMKGPYSNGYLGMMAIPGRHKKIHNRDLVQDLDRVKNVYHGEVIITLVREEELVNMNLNGRYFESITSTYSMISRHFPIKDKWLPKSTDDLCELVHFILSQLMDGKRVILHCNGGKGRAATVCCATMVAMGFDVGESIDIIRKARSGTLINPIQIMYLNLTFPRKYKKYCETHTPPNVQVQ
jgi:ADP-ribosyl-[dinitrogen reductase] hydrolase